jgi:hypothetical protein
MSLWLELEQVGLGEGLPLTTVLDAIPWNADGLIGAIAQRHDTGEVLMLAWMNRAALNETLATGQVCYWSRSRQQLWRKGETSGNHQRWSKRAWTAMATPFCCSSSNRARPATPGDSTASTTPSATSG